MVRRSVETIYIEELYERIKNPSDDRPGTSIEVCADFQRGTEEDGIWSKKKYSNYIDSLQANYPTGILTFVKDYSNARSYSEPWMILDGANRSRAICDFIDNKIKNGEGLFFKDLGEGPEGQQYKFRLLKLPCQFLTIEREDPPDTIATMFTRLNQSSTKLSHGELVKAHGWKGDVQIIEMAKCIIGDTWKTECSSAKLLAIRKQWEDALGKLSETKRCDNISAMCAYIISAAKGFKLFSPKYAVLTRYLDEILTENDLDNVCEKISCFLDMMKKTEFKMKKGMPHRTKIAPIWFAICEGRMTDELYNMMIDFSHCTSLDAVLDAKYNSILSAKGDNHSTTAKMEKAIRYIQEWGRKSVR
jgi:hypothetical protein